MSTPAERDAGAAASSAPHPERATPEVVFSQYEDESQIDAIMTLVDKELSEPYSIFTYRYFINNWPKLCILAHLRGECIGVVICKLDQHRDSYRGYVGMLVVDQRFRKLRLGSKLVSRALEVMQADGADECVLEVESTNQGALRLYQNLGFVRDKRLARYYLSGNDAYRMKLLFPLPPQRAEEQLAAAAAVVSHPEEIDGDGARG
jgi:peptide alpha-N-acetyltransferase